MTSVRTAGPRPKNLTRDFPGVKTGTATFGTRIMEGKLIFVRDVTIK